MALNTNIRIKVKTNAEKLAALYILAKGFNLKVGQEAERLALGGIKVNVNAVCGGEYVGISSFCCEAISAYENAINLTVFDFCDIDKAIEAIKDTPIIVKLNDEYDAEVSKAGIKVGCQNFPLEVARKLNEAALKVAAGIY
jgi:hypothetical protein